MGVEVCPLNQYNIKIRFAFCLFLLPLLDWNHAIFSPIAALTLCYFIILNILEEKKYILLSNQKSQESASLGKDYSVNYPANFLITVIITESLSKITRESKCFVHWQYNEQKPS